MEPFRWPEKQRADVPQTRQRALPRPAHLEPPKGLSGLRDERASFKGTPYTFPSATTKQVLSSGVTSTTQHPTDGAGTSPFVGKAKLCTTPCVPKEDHLHTVTDDSATEIK